jgi:hypothetical protein
MSGPDDLDGGETQTSRLAAALRDPAGCHLLDMSDVRAADDHGIASLLFAALRRTGAWDRERDAVRHALANMAREAALLDVIRQTDLARVLAAAAAEGIRVLVFKGAALAWTHYDEPWLRSRIDTDLLVRESDARRMSALFERLGYRWDLGAVGEVVTAQFQYVGKRSQMQLAYDVHWRIANPLVFADACSFDELERDSVTITPLGARAPADVHALIIACIHRVAHHYGDDTLIRLVDIDRLARGLSGNGWERLERVAAEKRVLAVVRRGLERAKRFFDTPVPGGFVECAPSATVEPCAAYLAARITRVDIMRSDLRALRSWRARARLVREHLFPPAWYMFARSGTTSHLALPRLYAMRIVRGAAAWFRPLRRRVAG